MEWFGPEVGSRACDPAGGRIYVPQGSASQFGTPFSPEGACTLDVASKFPRFQAHFDATVVSVDPDAGPTTLHLENGEIRRRTPRMVPLALPGGGAVPDSRHREVEWQQDRRRS